jgi:hypothetical protein
MACCEHVCPVIGCDVTYCDNQLRHTCPVHNLPMIRHWDERDNGEEEEHDGESTDNA